MNCPICGHEKTRVDRTTKTENGSSVERKRECANCGIKFWSIEWSQPPKSLFVIKKDKSLDTFSWERIFSSIQKTCKNLSIPYEDQREVFLNVMKDITRLAEGKERIKATVIGEVVLDHLRDLSSVAWLRFVVHTYDTEVNIRNAITKWL